MFNNSCDVKERKCQLIKAATHITINQIIKKLLLLEKLELVILLKWKYVMQLTKSPKTFLFK